MLYAQPDVGHAHPLHSARLVWMAIIFTQTSVLSVQPYVLYVHKQINAKPVLMGSIFLEQPAWAVMLDARHVMLPDVHHALTLHISAQKLASHVAVAVINAALPPTVLSVLQTLL